MATKEKRQGRDKLGAWDENIHTAIFKTDNQQGPTVQHREHCSVLRGNLMGWEFG